MNQVFYIASGRGGTGKSVFAVNLAATLGMMGRNTLLIDMNPGMRTLDLMLDAENEAIYHVFDVMDGVCMLEQAVVRMEKPASLYLLPGGLMEDRDRLDREKWQALIDDAKENFDFIVIDGAPGADEFVTTCAAAAEETLIVVTPEQTALRNADMLEDRLIRKRVLKRRYVLNRIYPSLTEQGLESEPQEINMQFKCEMLGMILEDDIFRVSSDAGIPAVLKKESYVSGNFRNIAERLIHK